VLTGAQGTGLARALMDFAEQQAMKLRLPRLTLHTNEVMTEDQAIYVHLGYRERAAIRRRIPARLHAEGTTVCMTTSGYGAPPEADAQQPVTAPQLHPPVPGAH
jgi:hypothetical protein